jgi:hypothetical protein
MAMKLLKILFRNFIVTVLLLTGLNQPLKADDSDINNDPFVVMYQSKLDEAHSELIAQEAKFALAQHNFETSNRLMAKQAITMDEYKRDYAAMKVEEAQVEVFKNRVVARKSALDVVILNRLAGRDIQQCI